MFILTHDKCMAAKIFDLISRLMIKLTSFFMIIYVIVSPRVHFTAASLTGKQDAFKI